MRVKLVPHPEEIGQHQSGIHRVVEAYARYLPQFGIEVASPNQAGWDLKAVHAGADDSADVAHTHGLYWTADYEAERWESRANAQVIENVRHARLVTVPSSWVGEAFRRDMRITPRVVQHGIDWDDWQAPVDNGGYALWNKNRTGDVCDPWPALNLAKAFPEVTFAMTFGLQSPPDNVQVTGLLPHEAMKLVVKRAAVYLSTTKETFGIGTLEAMASGVPVLGFAHGGNLDLIKHGETGYLARPGDFNDLVEGFRYCREHAQVLGANAREAAREWTWERAVEQVAEVYREAAEPEPATAAIIIPTFNYAETVGRAVDSALAQDYPELQEVIVVDDGSDDDGATQEVIDGYGTSTGPGLVYLRQNNQGVAIARNAGIAHSDAKYVACLDADDALDPGFLSACIRELEGDRSLGVAYTRLKWIKPDGSEGVSDWPGDFDYDQQLKRQNQIPTACVFRREAWERLGGYRQRYSPQGAGAEDAEFWLRLGAYGWGAKLVKGPPLFTYSWESGQVSGDPNYVEADWTAWHPWTHDEMHPFASVATPARYAHPVRQYDEPVVSVVIPVSPDHSSMVIDALDSLEAQTFRRWETIVVWDSPTDVPERLQKAYPYVHWLHLGDLSGPGEARNLGAGVARAPFLVFLDADDWLYPEALERLLETWRSENGIAYSDYVGKVQGLEPEKLAPDLQDRIYYQDEREAVIGYRSQEYDCELAQRQPDTDRQPYHWCLVTCLIPKVWHDEIGGFDESMETWEDVDYHWRMAQAGKCYARIPQELVVYRFYTGDRRAAGVQSYRTQIEYLKAKYEEVDLGSCNCGGGNGRVRTTRKYFPVAKASKAARATKSRATSATATNRVPLASRSASPSREVKPAGRVKMADEEFIEARYLSPNRGGHRVIGPNTKIDYGYRKGGDVFLIHKQDVDGQPHMFSAQGPAATSASAPPRAKTPAPTPPPAPVAAGEAMPADSSEEAAEAPAPGEFDLHALPGVTKPIAEAMTEAGIDSFDTIMDMGVDGLTDISGIGKVKAEQIYGAAEVLARVAARA